MERSGRFIFQCLAYGYGSQGLTALWRPRLAVNISIGSTSVIRDQSTLCIKVGWLIKFASERNLSEPVLTCTSLFRFGCITLCYFQTCWNLHEINQIISLNLAPYGLLPSCVRSHFLFIDIFLCHVIML